MIPRWLAAAVPVYFVTLLAIDTQVRLPGQLVLGAVREGEPDVAGHVGQVRGLSDAVRNFSA